MKPHLPKRILAISSQTVFGPVGNSVIAPTLQRLGHEVLQLPTVVLSNHPGHGKPEGPTLDPKTMWQMLEALQHLNALQPCDAVITGFFASAEQVSVAAQNISKMRVENPELLVLVDPVMGDNGSLYIKPKTAEAIQQQLMPLATITTPNAFELSWLTGQLVNDEASALAAASKLKTAEVIVTSVPGPGIQLSTLLHAADISTCHHVTKLTHIPNGTGDLLAALYLGFRLRHAPTEAFANTMTRLEEAVRKSHGSTVLLLH